MALNQIIRQSHRWSGLVFGFFLLISASSGLLHIYMSRTQPRPPGKASMAEPMKAEMIGVSPQQIIKNCEEKQKVVQSVNIRVIDGKAWYQVLLVGIKKPAYVNAETGQEDEMMDQRYAQKIAARHLNRQEVKFANYLTDFNDEYVSIFRVLPVYRFDVDDGRGTRVYVSTLSESVTRHTDDQRQLAANLFQWLHKFGFIKNKDMRDLLLGIVTVGMIIASALGFALYALKYRPKKS